MVLQILTMRSCRTWRFDSIILGKVWKSKFCDQSTQYQLRILQRFSSIFQGLKRKKRAPANVPASLDQPSTSSTSCEDQTSLLQNTCSPPDEISPIQVTTFFNLFLCVRCHSVSQLPDIKQLLDEVFVISGIIKVEVSVISRSRRLRLITLTEPLIIPDITKTESNNYFIVQAILIFFIIEAILTSLSANLTLLSVHFTLLLEIMHCARNLQIIH